MTEKEGSLVRRLTDASPAPFAEPQESIHYYENAEHIFILGPISNATIKKVEKIIQTNNKKIETIIHFQGENAILKRDQSSNQNRNKNQNRHKNLFGLKRKAGLFPNAFNLQGNVYNALRLRQILNKHNAVCYTVVTKNLTNNVARNKNTTRKNTTRNHSLDIMDLPERFKTYYDRITPYVIIQQRNNKSPNNTTLKLNTVMISQDLYDKDNFISLVQLLKSSKKSNNKLPKILLTGRAWFQPNKDSLLKMTNIMENPVIGSIKDKPVFHNMFKTKIMKEMVVGRNREGRNIIEKRLVTIYLEHHVHPPEMKLTKCFSHLTR